MHPSFQNAWIHIVTDLEVHATAVCKSKSNVPFIPLDDRNQIMDVAYRDGVRACIFNQRTGTMVFTLNIDLFWNVIGNSSFVEHIVYQIVCTFDEHAQSESAVSGVWHSERAGGAVDGEHEFDTSISVSLNISLTDIMGSPIHTPTVPMGSKVRLLATAGDLLQYKGLMPIGCDAVGVNTNKRYAILRAGCGDGIVLNKTEGFVTTGLSTLSPVFKIFHLSGDTNLVFQCNFTMCKSTCDGISCLIRNKKTNNS
ncbi:vitelline envelope sperm lysin receptor-like [Gigantopelta aegis]|uniref:vitelline envelope sperm lysin receptor-like n=1 Tax=Gigantopelta aegis TaxID=1735272 RepID=UPI001B887FB3|nr:vitelline envelope sperm lysin receptor-like [Gigantopelta aegis]